MHGTGDMLTHPSRRGQQGQWIASFGAVGVKEPMQSGNKSTPSPSDYSCCLLLPPVGLACHRLWRPRTTSGRPRVVSALSVSNSQPSALFLDQSFLHILLPFFRVQSHFWLEFS